jgi:putative ubiquitin-RnfH superfamily antitoxin RatB of RatAB toxin-antitoxin module
MSKRCRIVCDTPAGIRECELTLPDQADIHAAIEAARRVLGEEGIDWSRAVTGIFGRVHERSHVPADGDRIELYRALPIDPRRARRERAALKSTARRGRS